MRLASLIASVSQWRLPVRESRSLMRFAQHGELFCICAPRGAGQPLTDRRGGCRNCGLTLRPAGVERYDQVMTQEDIRRQLKSIERACRLASDLEIPDSVKDVVALEAYLAGNDPRQTRTRVQPAEVVVTTQWN